MTGSAVIEIASLFLGFVVGVQAVELAVDGAVAAVELRLDGRQVARLESPPWSVEVDFGEDLEPHRLEALAYDAAGRLRDRAWQLVNCSRADYAAVLVLDPADDGGARTGRLRWAAVLDQDPVRFDLSFDSQPLAAAPDGRFVLPPHDGGESHHLEAELLFADGRVVRAELAFGGTFGDRVTSALTAIPVTSPAGRPWTTEQVRGWLEVDGRPVEVFAARAEQGLLLVVRDEGLGQQVRRLRRELGRGQLFASAKTDPAPGYRATAVSPRPLKAHENTFQLARLGRLRQLGLGLLLLEERLFFGREKRQRRQQLWDAVALAGRHAAASNRPRAVLLMAGGDPRDDGVLDAPRARHYLESVRVPLFVWAPEPAALDRLAPAGAARRFSGAAGLADLVDRVTTELESQTLVWLEGEHLPADVALGAAAPPGVEVVR